MCIHQELLGKSEREEEEVEVTKVVAVGRDFRAMKAGKSREGKGVSSKSGCEG
jgi:hypothetical protein